MSDTPRTDDAELGYGKVTADFARQLERELNAANDRIKRLEEAGDAVIELCLEHNPEFWVENMNTYIAWQEAKEINP